MQEVTNNLQRIRELAVQSANATNSDSDRDALDQEVQQRIAEIDRIASQTSFNGRKVLDGSFGGATFQVGANVGETISLALTSSVKATAIGQVATSTGTVDLSTLFTTGGAAATAAADAADVTADSTAQARSPLSVDVDGRRRYAVDLHRRAATSAAAIDADIDATVTASLAARRDRAVSGYRRRGTDFAGSAARTAIGVHGRDGSTDGAAPAVRLSLARRSATRSARSAIQVGTDTAVDIAGTYATAQDLVDAINSQVSGAYASIDSTNHLVHLVERSDLTVGGAGATTLGARDAPRSAARWTPRTC